MKRALTPLAAGLILALLLAAAQPSLASSGCAGCVILVGLLERMALEQKVTLAQAASVICSNFDDGLIRTICNGLLDAALVKQIEADFRDGRSPDYSCNIGGMASLGLCEGFGQCVLYKQWPPRTDSGLTPAELYPAAAAAAAAAARSAPELSTDHRRQLELQFLSLASAFPHLMSGLVSSPEDTVRALEQIPGVRLLGDITKHLPLFDQDNDTFSDFGQLRGHDWRGRDCDEQNSAVYPGRRATSLGADKDHNCNGIVGRDSGGNSFEERFCGNSSPRGVAILGDSAAAHFRLPPSYLEAKSIDSNTFKGFLKLASNELDWPHCSWATGHADDPAQQLRDCPPSKLPFKSVYQRLRDRNRCNHRDYQNIGVNGARVTSMAPPGIVTAYQRSSQDQPSIVFHALIGNDVCNRRHNFDSMTPPAVFEEKVLATLRYLDDRLAPNSYVIFVPLADGRVLYETLADRVHPSGVPFPDVFDFLNCLETSPCWGWMNADASVRDRTTEHANKLNSVYKKIIKERRFNQFKMLYFDLDWQRMMRQWIARGNAGSDLIEPSDGFHPSTTANQLISEEVWQWLLAEHPEVVGPINRYNDDIRAAFGDQGGH